MKKIVLSILITTLVPLCSVALAEVTSRECPYSCASQGLDKSHCKDWKEGNTCFVDDMRASKKKSSKDELNREIVMINKAIRAGKSIEVRLPNNDPVDHLDAVVRREGGSSQTELSARLGDAMEFGSKQVDKNESHVVQFSANGARAEGRKLVLSANSGDVYIESIHVLTR